VTANEAGGPAETDSEMMRRVLMVPAMVCLIFGGFGWFVNSNDQAILDRTRDEPQELSLGKLLRDGPGDNHNVRITGVRIAKNFVVMERMGLVWSGVGVELVPDGATPGKGPVRAVALYGKLRGERAVADLIEGRTITGLVTNGLPFANMSADAGPMFRKLIEGRSGTDADAVIQIDGDPYLPDRGFLETRWLLVYGLLGMSIFFGLMALGAGPDDEDEAE
jgi:hypothetical protein